MLKIVYSVFLGVILALFVGVGISVFYPQPEAPEYPAEMRYEYGENGPSAQELEEQRVYDEAMELFQKNEMQPYNRNVSIIATIFAVALLGVGVVFSHKLDVIADGMLLGGIFTLIYGMGRGLATEQETYRFIVITIGLLIALALGYWKFAKPNNKLEAKESSK